MLAVPTGPKAGLTAVIEGPGVTVQFNGLLATAHRYHHGAARRAAGTWTVMPVALQCLAVPRRVRRMLPCYRPEPSRSWLPAIATVMPTGRRPGSGW